jgi:hypothetical protein
MVGWLGHASSAVDGGRCVRSVELHQLQVIILEGLGNGRLDMRTIGAGFGEGWVLRRNNCFSRNCNSDHVYSLSTECTLKLHPVPSNT